MHLNVSHQINIHSYFHSILGFKPKGQASLESKRIEMLPDDNYIPENSGFRTIEKIGKFVLILIYRCWRGCSAGILSLILLYWLYGGTVIFLLLASALIGAFFHFQDGLLYFPDQPESSRFFVQSPHKLGIPFENLYIKSKDGVQINILLLKQIDRRVSIAPTIIYFHGNAGNIGHRLLNAHLLYTYSGCNILLVEYRGYGRSEGSPSEKGTLCIFSSLSFSSYIFILCSPCHRGRWHACASPHLLSHASFCFFLAFIGPPHNKWVHGVNLGLMYG